MEAIRHLRRLLRTGWVPALGTAAIVFFGYHMVDGGRGLAAKARLEHEIERTEALVAEVRAQRLALERRVDLLRPRGLDADLLDEEARRVLGLARPDDLIILSR